MSIEKKCIEILDNGNRCGAFARKGKQHCFNHDPDSKEAKALAVKKGGESEPLMLKEPLEEVQLETPEDAKKLLNKIINEIRSGKLHPKIGSTLGYLTNEWIKAYEVHILKTKVDALKDVMAASKS